MKESVPNIQEFAAQDLLTRGRHNTAEREGLEALQTVQIDSGMAARMRQKAEFLGLQEFAKNDIIPTSIAPSSNGELRQKTRRTRMYGPDGKPLALYRPRGILTDGMRKKMLKYPPIAIALAARVSRVVLAFGQWAAESTDPMQRAFVRSAMPGIVQKLVYDGLFNSLAWGFSPNELIYTTKDIDLEVASDSEQEPTVVSAPVYGELDKARSTTITTGAIGGNGASTTIAPAPIQIVKSKLVRFEGANVIESSKDLDPDKTEIYVEGKLQHFAGLRYMADDSQFVDPLASFVVSHNARFGNIYGEAELENVYDAWYVAYAVSMFCNCYLERKGSPPYKAFAPTTAGYDSEGGVIYGRTIVMAGMEALRSGQTIVFPGDFDPVSKKRMFDVELMDEDPRVDLFLRYIEWQVRQILWGLLVPDGSVMQSSRVGSYASSQTYADLAVDLRSIDLEKIEGFVNKYIVQRMVAMNFPNPRPCTVKAKLRPDVRVMTLKGVLATMLQARPDNAAGATVIANTDVRDLLQQVGVPVKGLY